jgi:hypothetical protein
MGFLSIFLHFKQKQGKNSALFFKNIRFQPHDFTREPRRALWSGVKDFAFRFSYLLQNTFFIYHTELLC